MSALKSLAIVKLLAIVSIGDIVAPNLYAQTSTATSFPAKAKVPPPKTKPPARRAPSRSAPPAVNRPPGAAPAPKLPAEFSSGVPDADNLGNTEGLQDNTIGKAATPHRHNLGLVGAVSYFGSGAGLEYIFMLYPFMSIGTSITHTQASLTDDATDGASEYIEAQTNSLKVFARFPIFSFLYAGAGANYNLIKGEYGWKGSAIQEGRLKTDFNANIAALDVFLGSEWRLPWSTYLGVDWVGSSFPLGGTISYDANEEVELSSKALKNKTPNQRLDEETGAQLRLYFLNVRLGMTF